jgi:predicted  nucleic acid-binding Zn-ribbon protein
VSLESLRADFQARSSNWALCKDLNTLRSEVETSDSSRQSEFDRLEKQHQQLQVAFDRLNKKVKTLGRNLMPKSDFETLDRELESLRSDFRDGSSKLALARDDLQTLRSDFQTSNASRRSEHDDLRTQHRALEVWSELIRSALISGDWARAQETFRTIAKVQSSTISPIFPSSLSGEGAIGYVRGKDLLFDAKCILTQSSIAKNSKIQTSFMESPRIKRSFAAS